MRIIRLKLQNFQGINAAVFDFPDGGCADIYGDNATGKTTIFNAVTWLLFDKPSTGAKNFSPKTKGPDGDLHYLEHVAEALLTLNNGQKLTLRKVYKEIYKKKRGSATDEFDGHAIEYFIDGVPTKEKDYQTALNNYIGSEERLKSLMMPDYFSESLPWDTRRRILINMCGDVTDRDVIDSNPDLADLDAYLMVPGTDEKFYTVDEFKKIAAAKRQDINRDLQAVPARIDEAQKAMPDISSIDPERIERSLAEANALIEEKERLKRGMQVGNAKESEVNNAILALQTKLAEDRAAYAAELSKQNESLYAEIEQLKGKKLHNATALDGKRSSLNLKTRELETMKSARQTLIEAYNAKSAEQWQGDETCPTCKRPLPEEDVELAKAAFNLGKSLKLEELNTQGKQTCGKEMVAAVETMINGLTEEIKAAETVAESLETKIDAATLSIVKAVPYEETEAYKTAMQRISELRDGEKNTGDMVSDRINALNGEITALRTKIDALTADKSRIAVAKQQANRMEELAAMEKRLSREYEDLQRGVYLCDEFIKTKVSYLTENINTRFATVRFRLFVEQINGGVKEDCEVMIPNGDSQVPYAFANNAARINAGLEIIDALSRHWGIAVPVFVDNAESVTRLRDIGSQTIRLIVSEPDKTLRVESAAVNQRIPA